MSLRERAEVRLTLTDLSHQLEALRHRFGEAVRPVPQGIWDNRTFIDMKSGLYQLADRDWDRYPVELTAVARGQDLQAYFDCYAFLGTTKQSVRTRLCVEEVEQVGDRLRDGARTDVTEWNLLQINAAQTFIRMASENKRNGIYYHLVETFQMGRPAILREALDKYAPLPS